MFGILFVLVFLQSCEKKEEEKIKFNDFFENLKNTISDTIFSRKFYFGTQLQRYWMHGYSTDSFAVLSNVNGIIHKEDILNITSRYEIDTFKLVNEMNDLKKLTQRLNLVSIQNDSSRAQFKFNLGFIDTNTLPNFTYISTNGKFLIFPGEGILLYDYSEDKKIEKYYSQYFLKLDENWYLMYEL